MSSDGNVPMVHFNFSDEIGTAYVERVCPKCRRFIPMMHMGAVFSYADGLKTEGKCKRCGRVEPNFIGFY